MHGRLGLRRFRALAYGLPRDSATARAELGGAGELELELLASLTDEAAAGNWLFAQAHSSRRRVPPPKPTPRPWRRDEPQNDEPTPEPAEPHVLTPEEIDAMLEGRELGSG